MSDSYTSPPPESESTWKRKFKELEAELAVSRNLDPTAAMWVYHVQLVEA